MSFFLYTVLNRVRREGSTLKKQIGAPGHHGPEGRKYDPWGPQGPWGPLSLKGPTWGPQGPWGPDPPMNSI